MADQHQQTPIMLMSELAQLVTEHDRIHPQHTNTCRCHGGAVAAYKNGFAIPVPYTGVPHQRQWEQPNDESEEPNYPKPWMAPLEGETMEECRHRRNRTCFCCGHYEEDLAKLAKHEDIAHPYGH